MGHFFAKKVAKWQKSGFLKMSVLCPENGQICPIEKWV